MHWVIPGHHVPGVLVALLFNLFLGEVGERVARARYRLYCGINKYCSPPGVLERGSGSCPERIEVFADPGEICLTLVALSLVRCGFQVS